MSLQDVQSRLDLALAEANRPKADAKLIAVSKVQPEARVTAVLEQNHRLFGENRVQEATERWTPLRERFDDVELHLIGPLQTNKVNQALELFDVIQTVDRVKIARKIASAAQAKGKMPGLMVQVNTGEEPQKAGILPTELDGFLKDCVAMDLKIEGLMAIPPVDDTPALHFALLAKMAARNGISELSMGMSADFETAVKLGATYIRVGSAVFGDRIQP